MAALILLGSLLAQVALTQQVLHLVSERQAVEREVLLVAVSSSPRHPATPRTMETEAKVTWFLPPEMHFQEPSAAEICRQLRLLNLYLGTIRTRLVPRARTRYMAAKAKSILTETRAGAMAAVTGMKETKERGLEIFGPAIEAAA
jgi:hypothetical protein